MKKTNTLRSLWYNMSPNQRYMIRRLYYYPLDLWDKITGKREKYIPPRGYIYTGSPAGAKNYIEQGKRQLHILKQYISLKPNDNVLDIGCGIGRTAVALTRYLAPDAVYEGFDAVKKGINWCNATIKKDFPNFNFSYIPLHNDLYNKSGINAGEFVFPYKDESFDKVFLFSVFTHMQLHEIENYLGEIKRTLKPGGWCLCTLFVYNAKTEDYIADRNEFNFPVSGDGYRLMNDKVKSSNIAISEITLNKMITASGLIGINCIEGFWKDGKRDKNKIEYQDILVLKKS